MNKLMDEIHPLFYQFCMYVRGSHLCIYFSVDELFTDVIIIKLHNHISSKAGELLCVESFPLL